MTPVTRPRGRLPARVYWFRRAMVLTLAFGLVWGVAHLLGGRSGADDGPSARPVGADASGPTTSAAPPTSAPPQAVTSPRATQLGKGGRRAEVRPTVLASPEGTCTVSDVSAEPTVKGNAYAGQRVVFAVELTSRISPACTLTIGPSTLVLRLTSGSDRIWSTQDCRASVPTRKVVVRRDVPATVPVTWNGQRSDPGCTHSTSWAEPGYYHATAAVLGADPADRQFELRTPPRPVVTKSPKPNKPTPKGKPSASPSR